MPTDRISYQESGYFSKLIRDYLDRNPQLDPLYGHFPSLKNFAEQIREKSENYQQDHREVLVSVLNEQYADIDISLQSKAHITALLHDNTYTITTGHQLNLFTGPLYFLYKIISTINLCRQLKEAYPEKEFVPVYWMATEDHDFEEINHFSFKGKKLYWTRSSSGAVGRLSTEGLNEVYEYFSRELGPGRHADRLRELFKKSYLQHSNLADATRYLANELFGQYGLVVLDADDARLKRLFAPHIKAELSRQLSFKEVQKALPLLSTYNVQVNPREINLFYLEEGLRERIVEEDGVYSINNTEKVFSETDILGLVDNHPERFSPNVVLRPLYQEVILPNLCYIGGGGEIAYWLELKFVFEAYKTTFPMLLLRNSVLLSSEKQAGKAERLGLTWKDLFMPAAALADYQTSLLSDEPLNFSEQRSLLADMFAHMHSLATKTDPSFSGAVAAQEKKQLAGLENLEKRFLKAQKRKYRDTLDRIRMLQGELFPGGSLQERQANFSEFYLSAGDSLIPLLLDKLHPLEQEFLIIVTE